MKDRVLLSICLALGLACGKSGDESSAITWTRTIPTGNDDIGLTVRVDCDSVTVDETVHAEVILQTESRVRAELPDPKAIQLEKLLLRRWQLFPPEPTDDGRIVERLLLSLEPTLPGEAVIGPLVLPYEEDRNGEWVGGSLATPKIPLVVRSLGVPEEGPVELKPPRGAVWPRVNRLPLILGAAAGLVLLFVFLYWLFLRRYRRARPPVPPYRVALRELSELERKDLIERGELMRYYVELCDVLRRYIEGSFPIPAMELTTPELAETLKSYHAIDTEYHLAARDLFEEGDLVKFAKHRPDRDTARERLYQTKEFVRATSPREESSNDV